TTLVAHIRPASTLGADAYANLERETHAGLRQALPAYMVPSRVVAHQAFPLLPNGKIDRNALRETPSTPLPAEGRPEGERGAGSDIVSGKPTASEQAIMDVFEKITGRPVPSTASSFTDLGADSLNSIQAMLRLETLI